MKKTIISIILLVTALSVFAQASKPQWTAITSTSPESFQTRLLSSSENSVRVNVQVPGFFSTSVTTPRGEAHIISVPKSVSTAHAGEPDLPMTGVPVMIGDKARMDVRVVDAQYMDFENVEVAPSKGDFSRQVDPAKVPYTYGECYRQDAFFPASNLGLYDPYIIRDFRGQNMAIFPFAYNPVSKTLRVYYNMTVEMYKVDDKGTNTIESRRGNDVRMSSDFKSVYQRHFINFDEGLAKYTVLDEEGDLLIICYDNFISSMNDFVNWKRTRGVNTTIVGTSTAGSTYSAIQTYIRNQYNANNNLTHVLLVGDVAQIPGYTFTDGGSDWSGKGDNQYGQIVGSDIYNDVIIGRFSASSVAQVTTQVNRILTYERDLTTSATWCQNGLGISASAGSGGHYSEDDYQHVENLRTDLINYGYSTVYQDYASVSGFPSSSTTTISNHINSGVGIINYCNHGEQTGWQSHYYMNSNVNALTNNNKLPFIFSVACLVGQYDYSSGDCFAETWMHATNGSTPTGAISGMFSYISQPWVPPMWAQDEFVDILVESYNNNIKHSFGGAAINSLFSIFDHYSTTETSAIGTYKAWVLYGDPTLMMRTKTPQAMTVNHNGNITIGNNAYTVNVSNGNGALATITDASHNILGKATVSNNKATVTLNTSNLTPGTTLTLCVFGYNKVTYLGTIEVVGGTPYHITVTQPQHGSISAPSQAYAHATVTLAATPETSYCLSAWNVKDVNNNNITVTDNEFTMPESDVTVTATFIPGMQVTLASVMHGSINADLQYALQGNTINLTATPATGYVFDSWVVYKTGDVNTTVTVNDNSFTMPNYPVTVSAIFNEVVSNDVTIGSGSSTNEYLPTHSYYRYTLTQQIYKPSEVGSAGTITKVAFKVSNSQSASRNIDIYLSHTSTSTFSNNSSWIAQSTTYRVFSGSVNFNASGWTTITLDTPFEYNGTSNLLLTVDDNTGTYVSSSSSSPKFYVYSTSGNTSLGKYNDYTNYDPASMSASGTRATTNNQVVFTKEVPSTEGYLSVSPTSLSGFSNVAGGAPSDPQSIAVIGSNLQANLTITAPTGYQVCATQNGSYASTLTLSPSNGSLRSNVFVRLGTNANPGEYNGNLTLASGTASATVSLSGTVIPGNVKYPVTVAANPAEGGNVTGGGEYNYNTLVTVTASANTGYTFVNWTNHGEQVSAEASYSFNVSGTTELVANFAINSYVVAAIPSPAEGGSVTFGGNVSGEEHFYDFEDGTSQGWTLLQGPNSDSPDNWMHSTNYTTDNFTGHGHNASSGFMLSESLVQNSISVHPDNYLVSPQILLGGHINFWASNLSDDFGAEHFGVVVSTNGNAEVNDFTIVQEWTMSAERTGGTRTIDDGIWYEYTVDLSAFSGLGYVGIRHFNCYDQWLLCVDDITLTEGFTFNHGESCTVNAIPNTGYYFVNWTEGNAIVSTDASYTFTVTTDCELVANFAEEPLTSVQTVEFISGSNWWGTNLDITMEQLQEAIANALGTSGTAIIKSQHGTTTYSNGRWRPALTLDITELYEIILSTSCEITLEGTPVDPTQYEITINNGANWIGYLPNESMSVSEALAGLNPVKGDVIKAGNNSTSYTGTLWRGSLTTLEPGHGYIYISKDTQTKTFTFPGSEK